MWDKLREEFDRDIEYIAFTGIANPEKFNPDDYKEALHWSEI